jgi:membrane protease YdiL (CAAX protease family)
MPTWRSAPLDENPAWTLWEVVLLFVVGFIVTIITLFAAALAERRFVYPDQTWLDVLRFPEVMIGAQLIAYVLVLGLMYALVALIHGQNFFRAIRWNWPSSWGWYLLGGLTLSVGLQMFARLLPIPKHLPMDQFFQTPRQAWLLCSFSVTLAPLVEELFFRGFLYAALTCRIEKLLLRAFLNPALARRLAIGVSIFLTAAGFASIHGSQLTYAWGPVLIIFIVGLVLTVVRALTKSVGASLLLHMGYNGTIAIAMYAGTEGFRHLERLSQ